MYNNGSLAANNMEVKYKIIEITFVSQFRIHSLDEKFISESEQNIDFLIKELDEEDSGSLFRKYKIQPKGQYIITYEKEIAIVDKEWKTVQCLPQNYQEFELLLLQIFRIHAVQRHMIQFHSSLIDFDGHGHDVSWSFRDREDYPGRAVAYIS